ncbi:alpha-amylase family glycosyl hydrolase [Aquimonas sp.]|jgi:glycosidase|uniref:alpha-amylase family glycosyl hydrolase n=1 Tax=Aquimonas sp. TaxID=1872588 RepID=UPI0037C15512
MPLHCPLTQAVNGFRPRSRGVCIGIVLALFNDLAIAASPPADATTAQHIASPDWRDQVIYFALIDRFDDGDPGNNDQGAGEFDPADSRRYSGGDLAGLSRRLDYVRGLGATALWITPPVRHQWWDGAVNYGGYHGYWGQHFMQVDPHFGTLDDYRQLARALHGRGMYLVQDIVVNHTGNYMRYPDAHDPKAPASGFVINTEALPTQAPTQWPFDHNDARDPQQRALDIYHWNPAIRDYANPDQLLNWQMADLDDLNTDNPLVRRALRQSYGYWIREVGVDAFRVDTAFYVAPEYFRDFMHAADAAAPGVLAVAKASGREDFLLFGEGFGIDRAFEDTQARRIETYARDAQGPLLHSMINFPLYGSTLDVFARGRPPAELAHRIESMLAVHADPHRMPSFVDNHDVDRFLATGTQAGLQQALLLTMTLPGIPVIYYGTEQGFRSVRGSMFAGGWGAQGRDHFDTDSALYRYLQRVTALRHAEPALRRGRPRLLAAESAAPGALVYLTEHAGEAVLTAFNSATAASLYGAIDTGLAPGTQLRPLFAIDGTAPSLQVDTDGRIDLSLPALSGYVWKAGPVVTAETAAASIKHARPRLDALPTEPVRERLRVHGQARANADLQLVLDGDFGRATVLRSDAEGQIDSELDVRGRSDPALTHRLQLWDGEAGLASLSQSFRVEPVWTEVAVVTDPAGDDHGPDGRYRYPTDPGGAGRGLLDLLGARVSTSGGSLRLDITLAGLSQDWNPANGFDRVALTVYIELPDQANGLQLMPLQNDELPDGLRWHRRLRVHGWSNVLFSPDGAATDSEGTPVGSAGIEVDREASQIRLSLPARALGSLSELAGARLYVTTWDYDGGYRRLSPAGGSMQFGGGDGERDPLWMDALRIDLPQRP